MGISRQIQTSGLTQKGNMKETRKPRADDKFCGISRLTLFLLALSLAFIGKTMTGAYLNSMYTQIEKQFNIPASLVGIINGSFEIGNLLLIAFVSYFGGKFHRPKVIALGCTVFAFGCLLTSFPHFLFGRYHIESSVSPQENSSVVPLCHVNQSLFSLPTEEPSTVFRGFIACSEMLPAAIVPSAEILM
ncbi:solute carrier organic anion transporter family member 1A2-like [Meleagris gallopavo]|uniref:solute carrier organic anion transporter family member 1A2-like n=1 Tax=Meleagris gallopavo TaxID=9103 RepID=UPI0012AC4639|nr:solute carrier organic anion transporter family member 1A2-like [Meleagris gallopavo]